MYIMVHLFRLLTYLANKKNYSLVGGNTAGNNVFFVRNDVCGDLKILTTGQAYRKADFKEGKDKNGRLTFADFETRLKKIADLDVVDVENMQIIKINELV